MRASECLQLPQKTSLYVQLNECSQPETVTLTRQRKRNQHGTSPRSISSRETSTQTTHIVDTGTQTDHNDSEPSPSSTFVASVSKFGGQPQRVILHEYQTDSDKDNFNGNKSVQLHYMVKHSEAGEYLCKVSVRVGKEIDVSAIPRSFTVNPLQALKTTTIFINVVAREVGECKGLVSCKDLVEMLASRPPELSFTLTLNSYLLFLGTLTTPPVSVAEVPAFSSNDSRSSTPDLLDQTDAENSNAQLPRDYSDDDQLETIGRKVSKAIISVTNGNIISDIRRSDNGNISDTIDEVLKKRRCSDTRQIESTEEVTNDSVTDEEGEVPYNYTLRRKRYVHVWVRSAEDFAVLHFFIRGELGRPKWIRTHKHN